jgi:murein DD-endopeptidase MepM/ murein hydrolase activator NlpD
MYILLFIFLSLIFSGCANDDIAPIEYNYNKSNAQKNQSYSQKTVLKLDDEEISSSPIEVDDTQEAESSLPDTEIYDDNFKIIYHEVGENEDLDDIAAHFNQTPQEIRKLNNMKQGEEVEELQIIKIKTTNYSLNKKNKELSGASDSLNSKYIRPVDGKVATKFGEHVNGQKMNGIIIEAKAGIPIKSIGSGNVIYTNNDAKFGNLVIIKLDNSEIYVAYAHMQDLTVAKNSKIAQGEVIGRVGMSGDVTKPQLYIAIREGKIAVNPERYIKY